MPRGLNPLVSLLYLSWSTILLYKGAYLEPLIASITLLSLSGLLHRLIPLYAWIIVPPFLVLLILYSPSEALETVAAIGVLAIVYSAGLSSIDLRALPWLVGRLGLNPLVGFLPLMVLRSLDYLSLAVGEAYNSLAGRGVRGRHRLLLALPAPLVVHVFNLSWYMAEALYFKKPGRATTYIYKPEFTLWDLILLAYIFLASISLLLRGV